MMLLCLSIDLDFHFRETPAQYCCAYAQHMRQTSPPNKSTRQTALHTCVYMLCPTLMFLQISAHIIVRVMCPCKTFPRKDP